MTDLVQVMNIKNFVLVDKAKGGDLKKKMMHISIGYDGKGWFQWYHEGKGSQKRHGWKLDFTVNSSGICTGLYGDEQKIREGKNKGESTLKLISGISKKKQVRLTCMFLNGAAEGQVNLYEGKIVGNKFEGKMKIIEAARSGKMGKVGLEGKIGGKAKISYV